MLGPHTSATGQPSSDGECPRGESWCIYLEVTRNTGLGQASPDKVLPDYTWTENIIRDTFEWEIPGLNDGTCKAIIVSNTRCMIFKGNWGRNQGFAWEDCVKILDHIRGGWTWVRKDAVVNAMPLMVSEGQHILQKARKFVHEQHLTQIYGKLKEVSSTAAQPLTPESQTKGRGLTWRADKY